MDGAGDLFFDDIYRVARGDYDLGRLQDELVDLGVYLIISAIWNIIHARNRVPRALVIFFAALCLLGMSFVVNRFPLAAAVVLSVMKELISAGAGDLPFFNDIYRVVRGDDDLGRLQDELFDLGVYLMISVIWIIRARNRVPRALIIFIAALSLVAMSFVVNRFTLAATVLLTVVKKLILAGAGDLPFFNDIYRVVRGDYDLGGLQDELLDLDVYLMISAIRARNRVPRVLIIFIAALCLVTAFLWLLPFCSRW